MTLVITLAVTLVQRGRLPHARAALVEHMYDKETRPIRIQATVALSKLCGSEDPSDVEQVGPPSMSYSIPSTVILPRMYPSSTSHPPSNQTNAYSEVQHTSLLNIPIAKHALLAILTLSRPCSREKQTARPLTAPPWILSTHTYSPSPQGGSSSETVSGTVSPRSALPQGHSSVPGSITSGSLPRPRKAVV
jgi:hypothetical protein